MVNYRKVCHSRPGIKRTSVWLLNHIGNMILQLALNHLKATIFIVFSSLLENEQQNFGCRWRFCSSFFSISSAPLIWDVGLQIGNRTEIPRIGNRGKGYRYRTFIDRFSKIGISVFAVFAVFSFLFKFSRSLVDLKHPEGADWSGTGPSPKAH